MLGLLLPSLPSLLAAEACARASLPTAPLVVRCPCRELVPGARGIELAVFDLADLASVRAWALRAQDFGLPLDLLVNNAGVMACPQQATKDGFEYQLVRGLGWGEMGGGGGGGGGGRRCVWGHGEEGGGGGGGGPPMRVGGHGTASCIQAQAPALLVAAAHSSTCPSPHAPPCCCCSGCEPPGTLPAHQHAAAAAEVGTRPEGGDVQVLTRGHTGTAQTAWGLPAVQVLPQALGGVPSWRWAGGGGGQEVEACRGGLPVGECTVADRWLRQRERCTRCPPPLPHIRFPLCAARPIGRPAL